MDDGPANFLSEWDIEEPSDFPANLTKVENIEVWVPIMGIRMRDTRGWEDKVVKWRVVGGEIQIMIEIPKER